MLIRRHIHYAHRHNMVVLVFQTVICNFQKNASYSIGRRRLLLKECLHPLISLLWYTIFLLGRITGKFGSMCQWNLKLHCEERLQKCTQQVVVTTVAWHKDFIAVAD